MLSKIFWPLLIVCVAASAALAAGCARRPAETIVPYVGMPENMVPGVPEFYATSHVLGGNAGQTELA